MMHKIADVALKISHGTYAKELIDKNMLVIA